MLNNIISYVNFHFPNFKTSDYNDCFIKSCLVYKKYFKKTLDMNLIVYRLNDGLVDLLFQTN